MIDAKGTQDLEGCIRAYRHHPSFATTPILVVRCSEDETPRLIEAGATNNQNSTYLDSTVVNSLG